jgi:hypothetical protein
MGAFWGSPFQVVLAPMQWAMEKGHTIGRMVVHQMDTINMEDLEVQRLNPDEPELPSATKGPLNNLDHLVNCSHVFLNRHHDGRIYPVLLKPNEQVNVE